MDGFNGEHYRDTTAQKAIRHIECEERERIDEAIKAMKQELWLRGYEPVGRIILMDTRTGKIYR